MSENKKDNFKYAMNYIPFVAFWLYFLEQNKSSELSKHINYGMILTGGYLIWSIILRVFFLWWLAWILFIAYIIVSTVLWYKVYSWEDVDVEVFNNIEWKIKENFNKK